MGQAGADRPPDADEVDLDDALERRRVHRADEAGRGDAGVGDHGVDAAERLDRAGHGGVERLLVGDVGVEDDRAGAVRGDPPELVRAEPDERDARPARREAAGDLRADPVGGAGDEDGLAGERGHASDCNRGSSCSATTRSTASGRHGRERVERALRVAGRGVVEGEAERADEVVGDEALVERARDRQRGVRARRRRRDEQAAVGQRLELGDPVVLAPGRAHEDARAPQQRAVLRPRQHAREAHALDRPRRRGRPRAAPRPAAARSPRR